MAGVLKCLCAQQNLHRWVSVQYTGSPKRNKQVSSDTKLSFPALTARPQSFAVPSLGPVWPLYQGDRCQMSICYLLGPSSTSSCRQLDFKSVSISGRLSRLCQVNRWLADHALFNLSSSSLVQLFVPLRQTPLFCRES